MRVELNGNGNGGSPLERGLELLHAGLSVRAAAAASGVARSTLHDRARRVEREPARWRVSQA